MRTEGKLKHEGKAFLIAGYSVSEIADMFNASRDSVLTYNKRYWKVPLLRKMSEEDIEIAKKMILDGFTYKEVADEVGFKASTIADKNTEVWRLPYSSIQVAKKIIERTCKTCGTIFYVRVQKLKHDACDYCSKKCSHVGAIKPNKIISQIFRGYRWPYLSLEFRNKNPFCHRCGTTRRRLTVHHVKPWRLNGRNNEENLMVLCDSCHRYVKLGTQELFDLIDVDASVKLIQMIYKYRMEKIKWIYNKLNLQKLRN